MFFTLIVLLSSCMTEKQGRLSNLNYYKNGEFFYPWEEYNPTDDNVIKWMITRKQEKWPESVPLSFVGPKRVQMVGVPIEKLPPIDIVLITHDHYDHLDIKSIIKINKKFKPLFIVPEGVDKILIKNRVSNIKSLLWWESFSNNNITIHFVPSKHWSKRGAIGRNKTLWGSFIVQSLYYNIFFIGDSGFGPHIYEIAQKFGPMRLSFLPIGAYIPEWFMKKQHMTPEEAVETHIILKSQQSIGIHFDTFPLADEGYGDGPKRLKNYLHKKGMENDVFTPLKAGKRLELD